jgi:HTH-type transcriptional regulator / antitoxin HigA
MSIDYEKYKTPGQLIEDLLKSKDWTKRVLAVVLEMHDSTINRIISDKQSIDASLAISLEELFDVPAEKFLDLQKSYDLAKARITVRPDTSRTTRAHLFGALPVTEMIRRGWIHAEDIRDTVKVEESLVKFFNVSQINDIPTLSHAAKKTNADSQTTPIQLAWLYRVKQIASEMLVPKYSEHATIKAIESLKTLLPNPEEIRHVPRTLAECGIRFVIVESLTSAKIDGACFWLNEKSPVIGMTLRHDRIDNFWFVLRHELEHVLKRHSLNETIIDAELEGEKAGIGSSVSENEREANIAALNFCIPQNKLDAFIERKSPFFAERDILGFSNTHNIHPGIVAGQLQFKTGRYDRFRNHLVKVKGYITPSAVVDGWGDVAPVDF